MSFFCDPSVYRALEWRPELEGVCCFQIHPGDSHGEIQCWNREAIYVREDGFAPFATLIRPASPNFCWYGPTHVDRSRVPPLLAAFERFGARLVHARTVADLQRLDAEIDVPDSQALIVRAQLIRSVETLSHVIWRAACSRRGLWILGP
jgi:hypothetical protein